MQLHSRCVNGAHTVAVFANECFCPDHPHVPFIANGKQNNFPAPLPGRPVTNQIEFKPTVGRGKRKEGGREGGRRGPGNGCPRIQWGKWFMAQCRRAGRRRGRPAAALCLMSATCSSGRPSRVGIKHRQNYALVSANGPRYVRRLDFLNRKMLEAHRGGNVLATGLPRTIHNYYHQSKEDVPYCVWIVTEF